MAAALTRLSDALYPRQRLTLLLLLAPPLIWFGVVYLGALFNLLATSVFKLDDFSGRVTTELTLQNFLDLLAPANVDVVVRSTLMALMVTAACVAIVLLFLTKPLSYMPNAVLAAVVFIIAVRLVDIAGMRGILRRRPVEFGIACATAAIVVRMSR